MQLAHLVSQYADTCPGLEQYAIKRFAAALEAFPKVLADNSGCKATEVLSRLYAAHQEGRETAGFNVEVRGRFGDSGVRVFFWNSVGCLFHHDMHGFRAEVVRMW